MRKLIVIIVILLTFLSTFSQFLKVGFLLGSPYAFWKGEKFGGIDYDILKKVVSDMDYQLEIYILPFTALKPEILNVLNLDIVAGGIHMTEERKKTFSFSIPYIQSGLAIVLRNGLQWNGDVEKITFAVKESATGQKVIQDWLKEGKKVKYKTFVSNEEILANLLTKKIDAAFFDYVNALYLSRIYGFSIYKDLIYKIDIGYVILNKSIEKEFDEKLKKILDTYVKQVITSYVGTWK
ncbi:substrate-binding periplasmic protein [Fervidobacterium nodosum]|uniref:Extracellular solute-binding protein family 3 n=1 Tax=Fervidobacterium nodosum (strain ATCC 35602 / DSM 5306 / Rt17-B1) TaxID=381764 RepID=A7HJU4_FERNB|nr:transporter substrate-binding domain-containing protein [Fervidobacterium nodosum]ABS60177.1 extracellular solute-binding protein family 3 [Fervidobacterium nodosum Rt17-B1]